MFRNRYLCNCCFMPTVRNRGDFEVCPICFWEDDGQDIHASHIIVGGPNGQRSLDEARRDFQEHGVTFFCENEKLRHHRKELYSSYKKAMETLSEKDWAEALLLEERLPKSSG